MDFLKVKAIVLFVLLVGCSSDHAKDSSSTGGSPSNQGGTDNGENPDPSSSGGAPSNEGGSPSNEGGAEMMHEFDVCEHYCAASAVCPDDPLSCEAAGCFSDCMAECQDGVLLEKEHGCEAEGETFRLCGGQLDFCIATEFEDQVDILVESCPEEARLYLECMR